MRLSETSDTLREAYVTALDWRRATDGAFSPHRPDGVIDLDGIVKALAMAEVATALTVAGVRRWCLNVGGDVVCAGDGLPWVVGIVDPIERGALLCSVSVEGSRRAVASSGSAERGDHIWLDGDRNHAEFLQATVIADDIVTADVLATAIVSGGVAFRDWATDSWPIDVITVDRAGGLAATPGVRTSLAEP